jgi:hypothetical protein
MTSVQQKTQTIEFETALNVEEKDHEGKTFEWAKSLSLSVHIHNPSKACLTLWHGGTKDEYFCLELRNSESRQNVSIFLKRDELKVLETLLSNA